MAAEEANRLIDQRAFSWTDLFNQFEKTLPAEVRIAAVTPQIDANGRMVVSVTVISRRVEDLDGFIDALEKTGAFEGVLSRQELAQEDGTLRSIIQGYYNASGGAAVAATSEPAAPAATPAVPVAEAGR
jgi:Tfp pilus assembly protein PilN